MLLPDGGELRLLPNATTFWKNDEGGGHAGRRPFPDHGFSTFAASSCDPSSSHGALC